VTRPERDPHPDDRAALGWRRGRQDLSALLSSFRSKRFCLAIRLSWSPMACSGSPSWWVYILRCGDGTLYTGIALDVDARLTQHRAGTGAKYTRGREPLELVYQEPSPSRSAATRREAAIKRCSRGEKLILIQSMGVPE
jgi:predicted GIY-YIG superfamily endonuclease